jgi:gas vesicle protein
MRDRDDQAYIVVEKDRSGGVGAFLLGALLGAGVALLLAPRSGAETQRQLKEKAVKLRDAAEERVRDVQRQLEERLDQARAEVKERVEQVRSAVESGREAARDARTELEGRIERSKAAYRAGMDAGAGMDSGEEEREGA